MQCKVTVVLRSTTPLLINPMSQKQILDILHKTKVPKATDKPPEKIAAERIALITENGKMGIPRRMLIACFKNAGRYVKFDARRSITDSDGATRLFSFFQLLGGFYPFKNAKKGKVPWKVNIDKGSNDKNQAIPLIRPQIDNWEIEFSFLLDESEGMTEDKVIELIEAASKNCGLGSFSSAHGGEYGQFEIVKWHSEDYKGPAKARFKRTSSRTQTSANNEVSSAELTASR